MVSIEKDLQDNLIPNSPPGAGMPSTRPGFLNPNQAQSSALPGMELPQLLWATCSSASPASL